MAPGWLVMTVVVVVLVPLTVKPSWIFPIACWVASSARPEAAFWREKLRAAICSTREVERKETVMVASRAVMRRVRMRAEPEGEETGTHASGCWPGSLPKAARRANRDLGKVEIDCQRQLRRRSRLGNLRIKRAGASEATHKENSRVGAWARRREMVGADRRNTRFLRRSLGGGRFVVGDWRFFIVVGDFST